MVSFHIGIPAAHDWRPDRKAINTVFALNILKSFQPIFNECFSDFAKSLEKYVDQPAFDLTKHIFECNLSVICREYRRPIDNTYSENWKS